MQAIRAQPLDRPVVALLTRHAVRGTPTGDGLIVRDSPGNGRRQDEPVTPACFERPNCQRRQRRFSPFRFGGLFRLPSRGEGTNHLQQKRKTTMNKVKNNQEKPKAAAPMYQNQVRLVGFLGADPVQHENRAVFSVATKVSWRPDQDSDEWESITQWHHCVAWDKLAEAVLPLAKGDHVLVEGELRSSSYDRNLPVVGGGTTIVPTKVWEIRARAVRKLARKKKPAQRSAKALKAAA
jgi:hypothetical protein